MKTLKIKKGTTIETNRGTLLVATMVDASLANFSEYEYNIDTNEYDTLIDEHLVLTKSDVKDVLYRYFGENYNVTFEH